MISRIENTIVSTDSLKEIMERIMKIILLRNSHTVILKRWRRVNIKNSKFNNNTNNSYEIKSKVCKIKDLVVLLIL